ncbi:DUF1237-domain-containing protein [Mollisia scopiformis]|uniref:DUF1237-domain-containing protein n=1 Tax=Mollisia scopiformis TaxID=149040 RepID=A0A194XJC0_MOLSC|nr:DUF1237-domain-containing protein [Mollisia scopiformis]KUJ20345.1 DUF1237-domain-containing protein [Mollisia scopiformis]
MSRIQQRRRLAGLAIVLVVIAAFFLWQDEPVTWSSFPAVTESPAIQKDAVEPQKPLKVSTTISDPVPKVTKGPTKAPTDLGELPNPETTRWQDAEFPAASPTSAPTKTCIKYEQLQRLKQEPLSEGWRQFPYSRPSPECRTFNLPAMEKLIEKMRGIIKDPDLFRLFENSYPNTLDTMIKWRGYAEVVDESTGNETTTDEELTYVITGDIDAMWLRDSASQIYSYLPLLEASTEPDSLASVWRGLINLHARYIIISPYCHSFQPPPESGVPPTHNGAYSQNHPNPPYNPKLVFDCKWELDSLASFLQVSSAYYQKTKDLSFFQKYSWVTAVHAALNASAAMRIGTYSKDGKVLPSAWTFTGWTNRGSETLTNDGLGNPTKSNGMVRTAFRPSDDACIYQLLVPANMMFAKYLEEASLIMEGLGGDEPKNLTSQMRDFAQGIRKGIDEDVIIHHKDFGDIFAYEIDGYGGTNLMDDANIPSLLAMPLWNYSHSDMNSVATHDYDEIYANTRRFILSDANPYYMKGPIISAIGGPHLGPGRAWPMAAIVRALTAFTMLASTSGGTGSVAQSEKKARDDEIKGQIMMVLNSTAGTGVIHESVDSWNEQIWSRAWFGWANGLFGELIIRVAEEDEAREKGEEGWLSESWQ